MAEGKKPPVDEFPPDSNAALSPYGGTLDKGKRGRGVGTKDNPPSPETSQNFPWELFKKEQNLAKRLKDKFKSDEERRREGLEKMSTRKSTEV